MTTLIDPTDTRRPDLPARSVPPFGAFNATLLGIEAKRVLRNRRTIIMVIAIPAFVFLASSGASYAAEPYGRGTVGGMIMVGMALYGAMVSTAGAGAAVSVERSAGWSRQLRLTPLSPVAYVVTKAVVGMMLGAVAIAAVMALG